MGTMSARNQVASYMLVFKLISQAWARSDVAAIFEVTSEVERGSRCGRFCPRFTPDTMSY